MSTKKAVNEADQDVPLLELDQARTPEESDKDSAPPVAEVIEEAEPEQAEAAEQLELQQAPEETGVETLGQSEAANDGAATNDDAIPKEPEANSDSDEAMDTVRDLLFGDSLKAVRRELHLTVRNLRGSVKVMHHELLKRNDELAEQISAVQLALDNESEEREALSDIVAEQINQSSEQLKVKLSEQQDAVDVAIKQVNADVELAGNNHAHALEELEKKVFAALDEYAAEFRDGKMNRADFADMLSSLAGKVSADE